MWSAFGVVCVVGRWCGLCYRPLVWLGLLCGSVFGLAFAFVGGFRGGASSAAAAVAVVLARTSSPASCGACVMTANAARPTRTAKIVFQGGDGIEEGPADGGLESFFLSLDMDAAQKKQQRIQRIRRALPRRAGGRDLRLARFSITNFFCADAPQLLHPSPHLHLSPSCTHHPRPMMLRPVVSFSARSYLVSHSFDLANAAVNSL